VYNCYVVLREGPQMNADKRRFTAVFFVMRGGEISEFGDGRRVLIAVIICLNSGGASRNPNQPT